MLTAVLSPRDWVRTAEVLADGSVSRENLYPLPRRLSQPCPEGQPPWMMYLADGKARYRFVVLDFDAHDDVAQVETDVAACVRLLNQLSIAHVVCKSGPTGGRHVWISLADRIPAQTVALIGDVADRIWPSLDRTVLNSAGTGAVRPPGAPHRFGGVSRVLSGSVSMLREPDNTAEDVNALLEALSELAPAVEVDDYRGGNRTLTLVDADGHAYLPGARRPLGAAAQAALRTDSPTDASSVMFSVLLGAARARWRFDNVLALLEDAPGLEHARTARAERGRVDRSPRQSYATLARQWDRAVDRVANTRITPASEIVSGDPSAVYAITGIYAAAQAHAAAAPGRWSHTPGLHVGTGRSRAIDRAVLDQLHVRALQAMTPLVGVAVRTLALSLTVGRESVRQALLRLEADGWISLHQVASEGAAHTWSIDPTGAFHRQMLESWSALGSPTPQRIATAEARRQRTSVLELSAAQTEASSHDCFTPQALGVQAGRVYAAVTTGVAPTVPLDVLPAVLAQLRAAGLLIGSTDSGGLPPYPEARDAVAEAYGATGTLEARRHAYRLEQATWSYWQAECEATRRMAALSSISSRRRVAIAGDKHLLLAAYPRERGRPSWPQALDRVRDALAA